MSDTAVIEPTLVRIPAGKFPMGNDGREDSYHPVHSVFVSEFRIARHAVTNEEFAVFANATFFDTDAELVGHSFVHGRSPEVEGACWRHPNGEHSNIDGCERHPVAQLSFRDAMAYIDWLRAETGQPYRLATEAEWEKAAKGPEFLRFGCGNEPDPTTANIFESEIDCTTEVGSYRANGYGLFDMDGNVTEYVSSFCPADEAAYYAIDPGPDPKGPNEGQQMLKGGSFLCKNYGNYRRLNYFSFLSSNQTGLRLALS